MQRRRTAQPTAVDLFAGCGGLTSGLRAAGFNVLAAIENEEDAADTYAANHPGVVLYRSDIRRVRPRQLLRDLRVRQVGRVNLVAGCPPCQGFTRLTQRGHRRDSRNALVMEFLRFVRALRPDACMLENVPGLLTRGRSYFDKLSKGLRTAGYSVTYSVVDLADYGVPQFRRRLILLAVRGAPAAIPLATHTSPELIATSRLKPWKTVRQAIGSLPKPPLRSAVLEGGTRPPHQWHYARDIADYVRRRLVHSRRSGGDRKTLPASLRLACHERRPDGYNDVYGVMAWDRPAPTMTSGCTNASKGRFGHPGEARPLTAREAAVLQTFPLRYKFHGSGVESVAAQIGNALPKVFAKKMAESLLNRLGGPDGNGELGARRRHPG